jgi:hypothetical protein
VASIGRNIACVQGDVRKLEDLDRLYAKVSFQLLEGPLVELTSGPSTSEASRIAKPGPAALETVFAAIKLSNPRAHQTQR